MYTLEWNVGLYKAAMINNRTARIMLLHVHVSVVLDKVYA